MTLALQRLSEGRRERDLSAANSADKAIERRVTIAGSGQPAPRTVVVRQRRRRGRRLLTSFGAERVSLRTYTSFSQAAEENAYSRVLVGFHFRNATKEGIAYGYKIGEQAVTLLPPVR
jgi:hypothetical protein